MPESHQSASMTNSSSIAAASRRLSLSGENSPSSSTFYEVLYVGKIRISAKRTLKSFIDDSVNRFKCQEADRIRLQEFNQQKENEKPSKENSPNPSESVPVDNPGAPLPKNEEDPAFTHPLMPLPQQMPTTITSPVLKSKSSGHVKDDVCGAFLDKRLFEEPDSSSSSSETKTMEHFRARAASMSALQKNRMNHKESMGNKTMLMQIGRSDIRLIYPDRRQILFNKCLKDVIHCEEGVTHEEHFGFICRDHSSGGSLGYIFRCQSSSVVSDVMNTLRTAHRYVLEKNASCPTCPMVLYQTLLRDMEAAPNTRSAHSLLLKRLERLPEEERNTIMDKLKGAVTTEVEKRTEIILVLLKANCEIKQKTHRHCSDADVTDHKSVFLNEVGGSILRAKRSLTNSFSDMMKRKASMDGSIGGSPFPNLLHEQFNSPILECNEESPMRRRSQTLGSAPRETIQRELGAGSKIALFMRSSNKISAPISTPSKSAHHLRPPSQPSSPSKSISGTPRVRREIFKRVVTPRKSSEVKEQRDYKLLWKRVIKQQILLIRMERENKKIIESQFEAEERRLKLEYDQILSPVDDWIDFNSDFNLDNLEIKMRKGIPKAKRGEVWKYLSEHSKVIDSPSCSHDLPNIPYSELKQNLTPHQHAIIIDLGRTFPGHPYFGGSLGPGQLALYNVLKAYSLLDDEVGYCQGLAFVAGVLLMHTNNEEEAFHLLKHFMFVLGFRKQYQSDMIGLQIQMYQLSRLLHDVFKDIFDHTEDIGIDPSLYATSWFLTVFASNFPLGFVVRVFDLIFLEGIEGLFKAALCLISSSKDSILSCPSLDELMIFMKSDIPQMNDVQLNQVMDEAFSLSLTRQLSSYEIEYHVLQEELLTQSNSSSTDLDLEALRAENESLTRRIKTLEGIASTEYVLKTLPAHQESFTRDELVGILDRALYFNFEES